MVAMNGNVETDTPAIAIRSDHPGGALMEVVAPSDPNPRKLVDEERTCRIESDIGN